MRRSLLFVAVLLFGAVLSAHIHAQTVTELVIPQYVGSKTAATLNNARTTIAMCLRITGLTASTTYDVKFGLGLSTDGGTSFGAGNMWGTTVYNGTAKDTAAFTTDLNGDSGPFWIFFQPTGNGTRFDAGQVHTLRLAWMPTGPGVPTTVMYVSSKTITALDIAATERTTSTADDGAFLVGHALPYAGGKFILVYDNATGTGDPLFAYQARQAIPTQVSNSELPSVVNDIYMQSGASAIGDFVAVIPIGANNPNGVRRIEARNADNTIFKFATSADGTWPGGANTTTVARRDVATLTTNDAPLPIQLSSFTCRISLQGVTLSWSTASEQKNYGFEVQRSASGTDGFQPVSGLIPGHGTTLTPQSYVFSDIAGRQGEYYRLKQIDLDQTIRYSEVIRAESADGPAAPAVFALDQNYPNPFNPSTTICYGLPQKSEVRLAVFNLLGQQVSTLVSGVEEAGFHSVRFDGSGLASGTYFYRLQAGSFVECRKFTLVR